MAEFPTEGLVGNGRVSPQVLSNRRAQWVLDTSDYIRVDGDGTLVCPLDDVFDRPRNPVIVFGTPNVSLIMPGMGGRWDRFAAYMFRRKPAHWASTRSKDDNHTQGRVQAGVWCELMGATYLCKKALREALDDLVGTRKASCAHTLALTLHNAGFRRGNGQSLAHIYRPTQLARILWTEGLVYGTQVMRLRWIQAGPKSVSDHFVSSWLTESSSPQRAVQKQYCPGESSGPAPSFPPVAETLPLRDLWANTTDPKVRVGVSVPTKTGANLGYVLGQQPIFVVELPKDTAMHNAGEPLKPFPGKLDRVTWLKKNLLFRKIVVKLVRRNLVDRIEWLGEVPVSSVAAMLKPSPSIEYEDAFRYNYVATSSLLFLSRLTNATSRTTVLGKTRGELLDKFNKLVEWIMAKHVLISGYNLDVRLPGELWSHHENGDVVVYMNGNSGTYKPDSVRLVMGVKALKQAFPTVTIKTMLIDHD